MLARTGKSFPIIAVQEAGLDGSGFIACWSGKELKATSSIRPRLRRPGRRRWAKTDRIDGEALLRALLANKRGEPRVCAMVRVPMPEEEDRRRLCRERKVLIAERVEHVNRIKGLLFSQGVFGYEPLRREPRQRANELTTGDGRSLPAHLKTHISREVDRLELLLDQLKTAEAERNALLAEDQAAAPEQPGADVVLRSRTSAARSAPPPCGWRRCSATSTIVASLPSTPGLPQTPWQSGSVDREQGVSKAGNPPLRAILIELAWLSATPSAAIGAGSVVQRTGQTQRRPHEEDDYRGAGAQAAGGAVEICHRWRRH